MSTFPQVFRRSAFASYDPAITRIYTSTPHSVSSHNDFGLKYPVRAQNRIPRHIKVHKLDLGRLLGSDWVSGEREAGFIKAYGSGRVPWKHVDEVPKPKRGDSLGDLYLFDDEYPAPTDSGAELMEDVNTMSAAQFGAYLERVRRHRGEYLAGKLQHLGPKTAQKLALAEDKTLVNLAQKGHVATPDTQTFQVGLTTAKLDQVDSHTLHSAPHPIYGLSYSRQKPASSSFTPILTHKGRALDRARGNRSALRGMARTEGTNSAWVVSLGGVTATSNTTGGTLSDGAHIKEGVDFTRGDSSRGTSTFRITNAKVLNPPIVLHLKDTEQMIRAGLVNRKSRRSTSPHAAPLDTFKFDIQLDNVSDEQLRLISKVGTKEWSAHDGTSSEEVLNDWGDRHGIGGPRSGRKGGDALRTLRVFDERQKKIRSGQENHSNILAILERLKSKKE